MAAQQMLTDQNIYIFFFRHAIATWMIFQSKRGGKTHNQNDSSFGTPLVLNVVAKGVFLTVGFPPAICRRKPDCLSSHINLMRKTFKTRFEIVRNSAFQSKRNPRDAICSQEPGVDSSGRLARAGALPYPSSTHRFTFFISRLFFFFFIM